MASKTLRRFVIEIDGKTTTDMKWPEPLVESGGLDFMQSRELFLQVCVLGLITLLCVMCKFKFNVCLYKAILRSGM